jgi:hypothetical protein
MKLFEWTLSNEVAPAEQYSAKHKHYKDKIITVTAYTPYLWTNRLWWTLDLY